MNVPKIFRPQRNSIRIWLVLGGLVLERSGPILLASGTALVLIGAFCRLWAKGYLTQRLNLTTTGPYALCRNPFYFGNLLLDIGLCVMIGRLEVALVYLPVWFFFHYRQMAKEDLDLERDFGQAYRVFRAKTPRLIPTFNSIRFYFSDHFWQGSINWHNPNIVRRFEIPRLLIALSYSFLFVWWPVARRGDFSPLSQAPPLIVCVWSIWFVLLTSAFLLKRRINHLRSSGNQ